MHMIDNNEGIEMINDSRYFLYYGHPVSLDYLVDLKKCEYSKIKEYASDAGYGNIEGQQLVELWFHYGIYEKNSES